MASTDAIDERLAIGSADLSKYEVRSRITKDGRRRIIPSNMKTKLKIVAVALVTGVALTGLSSCQRQQESALKPIDKAALQTMVATTARELLVPGAGNQINHRCESGMMCERQSCLAASLFIFVASEFSSNRFRLL